MRYSKPKRIAFTNRGSKPASCSMLCRVNSVDNPPICMQKLGFCHLDHPSKPDHIDRALKHKHFGICGAAGGSLVQLRAADECWWWEISKRACPDQLCHQPQPKPWPVCCAAQLDRQLPVARRRSVDRGRGCGEPWEDFGGCGASRWFYSGRVYIQTLSQITKHAGMRLFRVFPARARPQVTGDRGRRRWVDWAAGQQGASNDCLNSRFW